MRAANLSSMPKNGKARLIPTVKAKLLEGKKGLVVGIANEQSIAWGCAAAFRAFGADLAVTYLNDKAKKHVDPLARALEVLNRDAARRPRARANGGRIRADRQGVGQTGLRRALDRVRAASRRCTGGWSTCRWMAF